METRSILKSGILTGKASKLHEKEGKYTFKVGKLATKGQIKEAIEKLFNVKVVDINILGDRERAKRSWVGSRKKYYREPVKKAVIKLKAGDKLNIYDSSEKHDKKS